MDIPSNKLAILHTRRHRHGEEREISRETESLLIVAQNNVIRINYVKSKID